MTDPVSEVKKRLVLMKEKKSHLFAIFCQLASALLATNKGMDAPGSVTEKACSESYVFSLDVHIILRQVLIGK